MLKQVMIVRTELGMGVGKISSQVAHASMAIFFNRMEKVPNSSGDLYKTLFTLEMESWMNTAFTKIVLGVETEKEIYEIAEKAKLANIPYAVIVDNGMVGFPGNKTTTCIALGPADSDHLDPITGGLKLL